MMKWNHWPLYVGAIIFLLILLLEAVGEFILPLVMPVRTRSEMFLGHIGIAVVVCLFLVFFVLRPLARNMKEMEGGEATLASAKSRLREMLLRLPVLVWTTNKELQFTSAEGSGYRFFNMLPDQILGKSLYEYFEVNDPEFYPIKMHQRVLRGESVRYDFEWMGHIFDTTLTPLYNDGGQIDGVLGMAINVTEQRKSESALRESEARLRELTLHMTRIAEEERKTLARELHDRVGQSLSAVNINLNIIKNALPGIRDEDLEKRLLDTMDLVREVTAGIRNVMCDLRPEVLDDYGLVPALRWYGEQFSKRTGLEVEVMGHEDIGGFDPELETTLFRIFQEAMTNVAKHAGARKIRVGAERDGETFRMSISDDGQGFEEEKIRKVGGPTYGLLGMRERARAIGARIQIESSPGKGTRVIVKMKLQERVR